MSNQNIKHKSVVALYDGIIKYEKRRASEVMKQPKISSKEMAEKEIMIEKAHEFVQNAIPFEMAPIELQNHHFFKVGYEIALRKQKNCNENREMRR